MTHDYPDDNDTSNSGAIPTIGELYLLYNGGNTLKEYVPPNLNENEVLDYASSQREALKKSISTCSWELLGSF